MSTPRIPPRNAGGFLVALGAALLAASGCTPDSGRYTVGGVVTYQGQPVEEGTITFEDPAAGQVNSSPLGAGGAYSMELPGGDFKISVAPPLVETKATADSPGDLVPKKVANIPVKYHRQETAGLSAQVQKNATKFDFDLKP